MSALAANPGDTRAMGALASYAPDMAFAMQDRQRQQQAGVLAPLAVGGDKAAMQQLYAADPDLASKLDDRQRKMFDLGMDALGNAAVEIALLPDQQRPDAWNTYIERLSPMFPDITRYKDQYSPASLNALLVQTGKAEKVREAREPKYMSVGEGGLVNVRDPAALATMMTTTMAA